jgi:hypothetical protein
MKPAVEVEVINRSSDDLSNAEARFGEYICKWGSLVRTASKSYMYYPHPIAAQTELHWDAAGSHQVRKLDLSKTYPRGSSGRLTFTIYDGRVEVTFSQKS